MEKELETKIYSENVVSPVEETPVSVDSLDIDPIFKHKDGRVFTKAQLLSNGYDEDRIKNGVTNNIITLIGDTRDSEQEFKSQDGRVFTNKQLIDAGYTQERIDDGILNGKISPIEKKNQIQTQQQPSQVISKGYSVGELPSTTSTTEVPKGEVVAPAPPVEPGKKTTKSQIIFPELDIPDDDYIALIKRKEELEKKKVDASQKEDMITSKGADEQLQLVNEKLKAINDNNEALGGSKIDDKRIEEEMKDFPFGHRTTTRPANVEGFKDGGRNVTQLLSYLRKNDPLAYYSALAQYKISAAIEDVNKDNQGQYNANDFLYSYNHPKKDFKGWSNNGEGVRQFENWYNSVDSDMGKYLGEVSKSKYQKSLDDYTEAMMNYGFSKNSINEFLKNRLSTKELELKTALPLGEDKAFPSGESLDGFTLESIGENLNLKNPIELAAFNVYKRERTLNESTANIQTPQDFERAAVKYAALNDPDIQKTLDMFGGDFDQLPPSMKGALINSALNNPDWIEKASKDGKLGSIYQGVKLNFRNQYPEFAETEVSQIISQAMEDSGEYNWLVNIPTQSQVDKVVENLQQKGKLTDQQVQIYYGKIRDDIGVLKSVYRGIARIPFGAFVEKSKLSSPGALENFLDGYNEGMEGIAKSINSELRGTGAISSLLPKNLVPNLIGKESPNLQQYYNVIDKNYKTVSVDYKGANAISSATGHLLGFTVPLIVSTTLLKKVPAGHIMTNVLAFEGNNREKALMLFPDDANKQTFYTLAATAGDAFLGNLLPTKAISKAFSSQIKNETASIINNLISGNITKDIAKQQLKNLTSTAVRFLGKNAKTAGVIESFGLYHDVIDKIFGDKKLEDVSYGDLVFNHLKSFKTTFLTTPLLTAMEMRGSGTGSVRANYKILWEISQSPEKFEKLVKEDVNSTPEQKQEMMSNLEKVVAITKDLQDKSLNLTKTQKQKYLANAVSKKIFETKAEETTDKTLKKSYLDKAKEREVVLNNILNGQDLAKEAGTYNISEAQEIAPGQENDLVETAVNPKVEGEVVGEEVPQVPKAEEKTKEIADAEADIEKRRQELNFYTVDKLKTDSAYSVYIDSEGNIIDGYQNMFNKTIAYANKIAYALFKIGKELPNKNGKRVFLLEVGGQEFKVTVEFDGSLNFKNGEFNITLKPWEGTENPNTVISDLQTHLNQVGREVLQKETGKVAKNEFIFEKNFKEEFETKYNAELAALKEKQTVGEEVPQVPKTEEKVTSQPIENPKVVVTGSRDGMENLESNNYSEKIDGEIKDPRGKKLKYDENDIAIETDGKGNQIVHIKTDAIDRANRPGFLQVSVILPEGTEVNKETIKKVFDEQVSGIKKKNNPYLRLNEVQQSDFTALKDAVVNELKNPTKEVKVGEEVPQVELLKQYDENQSIEDKVNFIKSNTLINRDAFKTDQEFVDYFERDRNSILNDIKEGKSKEDILQVNGQRNFENEVDKRYSDLLKQYGIGEEVPEVPKAVESLLPKEQTPTLSGVEQEQTIKQMMPFTDKMVEVERQFKNEGFEIDTDYDNEIQVLDKNGEIVDMEELPDNLKKLASDYEKATMKLGEFDASAREKALAESRKVTEVEAEEVTPKAETELPPTPEKATPKVEEEITPKINKDTKTEFTTKSGKQKVNKVNGELVVTDAKTGKRVSKPTERKAIKEWEENFNFSEGEIAPEFSGYGGTSPETAYAEHVIETSQNPLEIAQIFIGEEYEPIPLSTTESFIAEYGIGKITNKSFQRFGDRNLITLSLAKAYLNNKEGKSIDVIAKEMSDHYGYEITPQDIVDFMVKFPNGVSDALKMSETEVAQSAYAKFKKLTGLDLTRPLAERLIQKEFDKLSSEQQKLLNQDYERATQLESEYWKAYKETNGFTKESVVSEAKPTVEPKPKEPTAEKVEPTAELPKEEKIVEKTALQKATEARKAAKAKLDSLRKGLGINKQAELEALVDYHRALVKEAKEFIKEKVDDINEWAKSIGEKVNVVLQKAWDEAKGAKPIEKGEDLGYGIKDITEAELPSELKKADFGEGEKGKENKKQFDNLTSTIPNTGEITRYLSGETIKKYEGEEARNEQEVFAQQLREAAVRGNDIVNRGRELFGDDYVPKLLDYVETENLPPANKALIYVSLENDIAKQKIENPSKAQQLEKLQDLVRAKSQAFLRSSSLAINFGRLRKMAQVGYDVTRLTNDIFSSKEMEQKKIIEKSIEATPDEINKQAEEIKIKIEEGIQEEVAKIYESLSKEKKTYADKALSALDKIQQKIRNKTYSDVTGITAFIDAGITTIKAAIKAGVKVADAIELGINKIKELHQSKTGKIWEKENEFRIDITEAFKSEGVMGKTPAEKTQKELFAQEQKKLDAEIKRQKNVIDKLKEKLARYESGEVIESDVRKQMKDIPEIEELKQKVKEAKSAYYKRLSEQKRMEDNIKKLEDELDRVKNRKEKTPKEKTETVRQLTAEEKALADKIKEQNDLWSKEKENAKKLEKQYKALETERNRQLERVSILKEKLEALKRGEKPKKNEREIKLDTPEIEALKAEIKQEERKLDEANAKMGKTVAERLEDAKERIKKQIESIREQIANKERVKGKDKLKPDAELENLSKQRDALNSLLDKYVLKPESFLEEKNLKVAKAKLENEILDLNRQIQKGQKDKFNEKESKENAELDKLKAEKEARQAILEALDPTPKIFIENALIEQGYGRQINIKTKEGVEKRWVLDWKKLAGEEGSVDNIRQKVEAALKDKGYTEEQILRMKDAFVEEYNNLRASIIEKSMNEIAAKNKQTITPEQKAAAKKLAEMYNYGLFDKNPAEYEVAMAKTLGLSIASQEAIVESVEMGQAMSNMFNVNYEGRPLTESQLRTAIQVIDEKMRMILYKESMKKGNFAFKASNMAKNYMDMSQRMLLNTIKQGIENPMSGLFERFYSSIGYSGKIPKQLNAQQRRLAKDIYKEMVLQKGIGYGNVSSAFVAKGNVDVYIEKMSDHQLVQAVISTAMGKTILDAVDSSFKAKITQQKFTYNLIKILTKDRKIDGKIEKGMSLSEAKNYVAEKISGQSFENAKETARNIIKKVNEGAGKKIFNDSELFVNRLATDIVNASLINGEKITEDMVTASYNAAYKAAGRGLGHVSNNFISEAVNTTSGKIESKINEAIKEDNYNKATFLNFYSILYRNIINPFVGGGTNWIVLKAEKAGLGLVSGLGSLLTKKGKIDLTTENGLKNLENTLYEEMKIRDKFIRGAVGGAVTALTYLLIKGTDTDDKFEEWLKKNDWAKKYANIITPEIALALIASKSEKDYKKYLESSFNKNEAFDKASMAIKAATYLASGKKEKGYGKLGELVGGSIGVPLPWRLIRDGQNIYLGVTGKEPYKVDSQPSESFKEGFFKGGLIDYLGYAPKKDQKDLEIEKAKIQKSRIDKDKIKNYKTGKTATDEEIDLYVNKYNELIDKKVQFMKSNGVVAIEKGVPVTKPYSEASEEQIKKEIESYKRELSEKLKQRIFGAQPRREKALETLESKKLKMYRHKRENKQGILLKR